MATLIDREMNESELAIADHFERGLSQEELKNASFRFGSAVSELFPAYLTELLHQRAVKDGETQFEVMRKAMESYLIPA